MKRTLLILAISITSFYSYAQNTFPSSGNVGIGTTSPTFLLDVRGKIGISGTQALFLPDQTNFLGSFVVGNGGGSLTHTSGADGFQNTFVGLSVGSATTTAVGNTAIGYWSLVTNTTGNCNTAIGVSTLAANTTGYYNTAVGAYALLTNTTGQHNIASGMYSLFSNTTGSFNAATGEYSLRGNTTGGWNTGIGYIALGGNTTGSNNTAIGYLAGNFIADGTTPNAAGSNSLFLGSNNEALADGDNNEIVIGYNTIGNGTNSVTLGNGSITKTVLRGNVGIGTNTPDAKLAVNGTIHTKEVKVDLSGWPDYVFKPKYKLTSLATVKAYIDQNRHLPEMPSETEVAKDGINLGEMNKLLVKKVEELTLYLIKQNEEIDELKKQVAELLKKSN